MQRIADGLLTDALTTRARTRLFEMKEEKRNIERLAFCQARFAALARYFLSAE